MRQKAQSISEELRSELQQIYGDRLRGVYVFGSYAREQEDDRSDFDVLYVLDEYQDYYEEIKRTSYLVADLSLKCDVTVCAIPIKESKWQYEDSPFLRNVRREGVFV